MSADEMRKVMANIDYMGNGKINYSEFLAATISVKSVMTYDKLWALFKHFDTDNSGYITEDNIEEAFAKAGKQLSKEDIKEMIKSHDLEKNGKLSFEEFKEIFQEANI